MKYFELLKLEVDDCVKILQIVQGIRLSALPTDQMIFLLIVQLLTQHLAAEFAKFTEFLTVSTNLASTGRDKPLHVEQANF